MEEKIEDNEGSDDEGIKLKETGKIEEVTEEKFDKMKYLKDDKSLTKHIISIMVKNKKTECYCKKYFSFHFFLSAPIGRPYNNWLYRRQLDCLSATNLCYVLFFIQFY